MAKKKFINQEYTKTTFAVQILMTIVVGLFALPIFMIVQCLIAYHYIKHPVKTEEKKAPRKIKR